MTFDEVLDQVRELLQQRGRVTYRSLKLRYQLDDEVLAGVTDELIKAERLAVDENGEVLVWVGEGKGARSQLLVLRSPQSSAPSLQPPSSYTPQHLADRIRAATVTEGERKMITALFSLSIGLKAISQTFHTAADCFVANPITFFL